jgi:(p)ppGpp synthase/HD superfamily hydrolase
MRGVQSIAINNGLIEPGPPGAHERLVGCVRTGAFSDGEAAMLTDRFDEAFQYAHRLHRDQKRKGTSIPYISHLLTVAALVIEHGGDEDQAIAALLHDVAEDQGGKATLANVKARFGPVVAEIVSDCTDAWTEPKPEWRMRKEAYLAALPDKLERSLLVSLADKTHNAEAILFDYQALGDELWDRFNGGADGTRWYYAALARFFSDTMPGRLSDRLSRAVAGFAA